MFKDLEIVYKENNNKSYFHIPQLGLIASGDNIEEARKNLQIEYEKYKKKSVEADINIDESNSFYIVFCGLCNSQIFMKWSLTVYDIYLVGHHSIYSWHILCDKVIHVFVIPTMKTCMRLEVKSSS